MHQISFSTFELSMFILSPVVGGLLLGLMTKIAKKFLLGIILLNFAFNFVVAFLLGHYVLSGFRYLVSLI